MTAIWFVTIEEAFFFAAITVAIARTLSYLHRRADRMLGSKVAAIGCVMVGAALLAMRGLVRLLSVASNPLIASSPVTSRGLMMLLFSVACFLVVLVYASLLSAAAETEDRAEGRHYEPPPAFMVRLRAALKRGEG